MIEESRKDEGPKTGAGQRDAQKPGKEAEDKQDVVV